LERFESVGHGQATVAHAACKARKLRFGHHRRDGAKLQRTGHMIVSIVTRSVDSHEQFSCTYRARINRHTGQPGHGVESRPRPSTQSASHLCNRPPHKFLKGLVLVQCPTSRSVFDVLRAPPLKKRGSLLAAPGCMGLKRPRHCLLTSALGAKPRAVLLRPFKTTLAQRA